MCLFWRYGNPARIDSRDSLSYSAGVGHLTAGGRWSASLCGFSQPIDGGTGPAHVALAMLALTGSQQKK